jgi:hypothetical protein
MVGFDLSGESERKIQRPVWQLNGNAQRVKAGELGGEFAFDRHGNTVLSLPTHFPQSFVEPVNNV